MGELGSFPVGSAGLLGIFCFPCNKHIRRGGVAGERKGEAQSLAVELPEVGAGPAADEARTFYNVEAKNFQKKHSVASSL